MGVVPLPPTQSTFTPIVCFCATVLSMPPIPIESFLVEEPLIEKSVVVLNVRERAEKSLFKTVLGRVLPENTRSVVEVLDTNGDEEKFKDVPLNAPPDVVNQSALAPDAPVHV